MPNISFILAYYKIYKVHAKESLHSNAYLSIPVYFITICKKKFRVQQHKNVVYFAWKNAESFYYSNDFVLHHPKGLYERLFRDD